MERAVVVFKASFKKQNIWVNLKIYQCNFTRTFDVGYYTRQKLREDGESVEMAPFSTERLAP